MRTKLRPPARAITLTGFMGTGKSSVGWGLAQQLGMPLVDTDDLVEENTEMTIPEIFAKHGEGYFRDVETTVLQQALQTPGIILATGGGILLRPQNVELLRAAGPIICLEASPETILRRTAHTNHRPLLEADDPLERIRRLLAERASAYAQADYHVDTDHDDQERTRQEIVNLLRTDPSTVYTFCPALQVRVEMGRDAYAIRVGPGVLAELGRLYPPPSPHARCVVVTTDTIGPLWAQAALDGLQGGGWRPELLTVPDGEESKNWLRAGELLDHLSGLRMDRGLTVFALGGGVVGDLAGFVAAVYLRGVDFVQLPTSLLAQVDASIGGKVAVDLPQGKNLVGAFHQPRAVFIDTDTLRTLPEREFISGMGEIIKHAVIADAELFDYLGSHLKQIIAREELPMKYLVARNCQIKAEVVEQDPRDRGVRHMLNFGHTVGHALERAVGDWELRHGEAVALGMVADMRLAVRMDLTDRETAARVEGLIASYGLPTRLRNVDPQSIQAALVRDKKIVHGALRMPLVTALGSARVYEGINLSHLQAVIEELTE